MLAITVIIISTFSAAFLIIHKEINHCKNLDNVIRLINIIKNKSLYYGIPFCEIISELKNNRNFEKSELIDKFCSNISDGYSVPEAWKSAVKSSSAYFETYECDTIIRYGEELCQCNMEEISEISDNAISELQEFRKTAIEKRNIKSKSTAAVTISSGLIIILMFI